MGYKATIELTASQGMLDAIRKEAVIRDRSSVSITENKGMIIAEIKAADLTALRASINSLMQLAAVHDKISRIK